MRNSRLAACALAMVVLLVPGAILAQGYGTDPAPSSASSDQHVIGTVVSISTDRLELKSEPATGETSTASGSGETLSFTLAAGVDKPMDLKAGDRAEVWYKLDNGERVVSRIALASGSEQSTSTTTTSSSSEALPQTASNVPLIGLIGLLALGAALALRGYARA